MNISNTNLNSLTSVSTLDNLSPSTPDGSSQNLTPQSSTPNDANLLAKTSELAFSASFLSSQINNQIDNQQRVSNDTDSNTRAKDTDPSPQIPPGVATCDAARNLK